MTVSGRLPRAALLVLPVVIVLAAVAIVASRTPSWHHRPARAAAAVSAPPSAHPLTGPIASSLASRLVAGTEASVRSALAISGGQTVDPTAVRQLAALRSITFDLATVRYIDPQTATVTGHVAHPPAGTSAVWTFTIAYVSPDWKLIDGKPSP
jgi:hypothetical protein